MSNTLTDNVKIPADVATPSKPVFVFREPATSEKFAFLIVISAPLMLLAWFQWTGRIGDAQFHPAVLWTGLGQVSMIAVALFIRNPTWVRGWAALFAFMAATSSMDTYQALAWSVLRRLVDAGHDVGASTVLCFGVYSAIFCWAVAIGIRISRSYRKVQTVDDYGRRVSS